MHVVLAELVNKVAGGDLRKAITLVQGRDDHDIVLSSLLGLGNLLLLRRKFSKLLFVVT